MHRSNSTLAPLSLAATRRSSASLRSATTDSSLQSYHFIESTSLSFLSTQTFLMFYYDCGRPADIRKRVQNIWMNQRQNLILDPTEPITHVPRFDGGLRFSMDYYSWSDFIDYHHLLRYTWMFLALIYTRNFHPTSMTIWYIFSLFSICIFRFSTKFSPIFHLQFFPTTRMGHWQQWARTFCYIETDRARKGVSNDYKIFEIWIGSDRHIFKNIALFEGSVLCLWIVSGNMIVNTILLVYSRSS